MQKSKINNYLSSDDFNWFRRFIESEVGIRIHDNKHIFMTNRLIKRVERLGIDSINEYRRFLETSDQRFFEKRKLFEEIVTSESSFFRYQIQYDMLGNKIVPEFVSERIDKGHYVKIISLGSSYGQEIYSAAMVIAEKLSVEDRFFVKLSAADISEKNINKAKAGYYEEYDLKEIPGRYIDNYFFKENGGFRLSPKIINLVEFSQFNLISENWNPYKNADLIFCRNTIIYFGEKKREYVLNRISHSLRKGGYLFLGHSEMIDPKKHGLVQLGNSILRKV
ncbi:MAG: protein-glutamate O-methyltransferase CheR [Candidatus Krumholzibacteriota bacterium]|nr:protein-glutamate O-methyltransferase CheR [Candidatus Krumholzibacteriota bacterium]